MSFQDELPIQRQRSQLPTVYIVCTVPGHEDATYVHSYGLARAIVALSQEPGRASKRMVSKADYERVLARIEAQQAAEQAAPDDGTVSWIERSAKESE